MVPLEPPVIRRARLAVAAFILLLALGSPINHFNSDPQFALLVSQGVLEHGSLGLDPYRAAIEARSGGFHPQIRADGDTWRHAYPLGTPLLSLPAVAAARLLGRDMANERDEFTLQNILSAAVCVAVFLLFYAIAREFVSPLASLVIAAVAVLGSPVMSTGATGLWSADYAVVLVSLALLWIIRQRERVDPRLLGLALAAAFLCRPQTAVFAIVVLLYLVARRPSRALLAGGVVLAVVAIAALANHADGGVWVPWYFSLAAALRTDSLGRHLYGVLASPSRGLFTFCPFFLLPLAGALLCWRPLARNAWARLAAAWLVLHTLMVATWPGWWGGHSFGPRLMLEVVPALTLLTALVWQQLQERPPARRRGAAVAFVALGAVGVAIHSGEGLFNLSAARWSAVPDIGEDPDLLFDWRYPQFLATLASLRERHLDYVQRRIDSGALVVDPSPWSARLDPTTTPYAVFVGWWNAGPDEWWSESDRAYVLFRAADVDPNGRYALQITSASLGAQRAAVRVNGVDVGALPVDGDEASATLPVPGSALRAGAINTVTFEIPTAHFPSFADIRRLGLRYAPHRLALERTWIALHDTHSRPSTAAAAGTADVVAEAAVHPEGNSP